jgi:hypothetical protein
MKVSDKSIKKLAEMNNLDFISLKNFTETTDSGWKYIRSRYEGRELVICP